MAPRLKVFVTSDGLTDYVVAVSSRTKALAAWGVRQDLFKEGAAHETDDPELTRAALARPGEVLRRPAGSRAALAQAKARAKPEPKAPSRAALRRVETLERRLQAAERDYDRAAAQIAAARARLDAKAAKLAADHRVETARVAKDLEAARDALRP